MSSTARKRALFTCVALCLALGTKAQIALIDLKKTDSTVLATVTGVDWSHLLTDVDSISFETIRKVTFEEWQGEYIHIYRSLDNNRIPYKFKPELFEEVAEQVTFRIPCIQNYQHASYQFEIGDFDGVVSSLTECSTVTLSKEEKILVYNLLSKAEYSLRDIENAESRARLVYRQNPEYIPASNEGPGIKGLYERVRPTVSSGLSFYAGVNFGLPTTITSNTYEGNPVYRAKTEHTPDVGYYGGFQWRYFADFPIQPAVGLAISQTNFVRTSESGSSAFQTLTTQATESNQLLQGEILGRYSFRKPIGSIDAFAELGLYYAHVLSSEVKVETTFLAQGGGIAEESSDPVDFTDRRRGSLGLILAAGGARKVRRGNVFFKLQLQLGLTSMVDTSKVYQDTNLAFSQYYFDNDYLLNRITLTVGYERLFFKFK